jgi:hypothetical protein
MYILRLMAKPPEEGEGEEPRSPIRTAGVTAAAGVGRGG